MIILCIPKITNALWVAIKFLWAVCGSIITIVLVSVILVELIKMCWTHIVTMWKKIWRKQERQ